MSDKHFPVSWDQFHRDCRALAWRLQSAGPFKKIVCITRGGLVPAAIVARELNIRIIDTVCVASYKGKKSDDLDIMKWFPDSPLLHPLLIIDDLVDTGKTMRYMRNVLTDAHYAAVYAKPQGREQVDTYVTEVSQDTWIYFPWDTGLSFLPPIKEGGE